MLSLLVRISFWILEGHLGPSQPSFSTRRHFSIIFQKLGSPHKLPGVVCPMQVRKHGTDSALPKGKALGFSDEAFRLHRLPNKRFTGNTSRPSTTSKAQIRLPDLVTFHLEARTSSSQTQRALWKPSKWGPLGLTHLKKAELSVKGKDQRERGTCWIISWIWLRISRQRKIQDLPYWTSLLHPCQKGLLCSLLPLLSRRKREGEEDHLKAQFNYKHFL